MVPRAPYHWVKPFASDEEGTDHIPGVTKMVTSTFVNLRACSYIRANVATREHVRYLYGNPVDFHGIRNLNFKGALKLLGRGTFNAVNLAAPRQPASFNGLHLVLHDVL